MRYFPTFITLILILTSTNSHGLQEDPPINQSLETTASARLSEEFLRVAHMAAMSDPLDTTAILATVALVTESSRLTPNSASVWRTMIEVAQMADLPELRTFAIQELLRVTPNQTTVQLARIRDVIEGTNTVEQRMAVYEKLLMGDQSNKLDPRVASRIAFDAANLQRQLGDIPQFSRWLAESVALDPSYPDAITMAAGFFGDETAGVQQRAELLASAVLSNIRDNTSQVAFAEFLIAYGDYKDAKAIYEVVLGDNAGNDSVIQNGLLADIVLCQWAAGDVEAAMNSLTERQISVDARHRMLIRRDQPRLTPLELARIHAPLVPKLATVRAAIYAEQKSPEEATAALESALESIRTLSKLYDEQGEKAKQKVLELLLQAAWISLWIGDEVEMANSIIEYAQLQFEIDPTERQKLNGWIALREGDTTTARGLLLELGDDPMAGAGLALIYLQEGSTRAAASEFLKIARQQGGTLLGVWANKQLEKIVGSGFHLWPETDQLQIFMSGVLETIDDFVSDPRPPIEIRVIPEKEAFSPYDPILVTIEIKNNTTIPLTIAKNGPLQPLLLIESLVEISNLTIHSSQPIIIPIDSELTIKPRETLIIQTNLREHWLGGMLNSFPLRGASIQLNSTINFSARETTKTSGVKTFVYMVSRLGQRHKTDIFRFDGVRLYDTWLKRAIERSNNIEKMQDLVSLVLLTWIVGDDVTIKIEKPLIDPPEGEEVVAQDGGRLALQDEAITTVLSVFPGLGPKSQAWVIATMSIDPSIEAVVRMMKEPKSTVAQLALLLRFASTAIPDEALDDPLLLDALESEDKSVRDVANWVYAWVKMVVKQRLEQQLGTSDVEDL